MSVSTLRFIFVSELSFYMSLNFLVTDFHLLEFYWHVSREVFDFDLNLVYIQ